MEMKHKEKLAAAALLGGVVAAAWIAQGRPKTSSSQDSTQGRSSGPESSHQKEDRNSGCAAPTTSAENAVARSGSTPSPEPASKARGGSIGWWLAALGLVAGLAAVLLLEPRGGAERRARLREALLEGSRRARTLLRRRSLPFQAEVLRGVEQVQSLLGVRLGLEGFVPDRLLRAQLRDALSGLVEEPRALHLAVKRGHVTLTGRAPAELHDEIARAIVTIPGVVELDNRLEALPDDR